MCAFLCIALTVLAKNCVVNTFSVVTFIEKLLASRRSCFLNFLAMSMGT